MLPAETRLGPVRLQVSDLGRSLEYYERILGLQPLGRAQLLGSGSGDPLVELVERAGASVAPRRGRLGLYHFAIVLPDRRDLGAFLRHLAEVGMTPGMSDHLVSEALYLHDPDGLGIEVYADRPRDAWHTRDGELVMTVEPLDVGSLLGAAEGPWRGMPDGARMGHVHLSVDDLPRASRFYHESLGLERRVWSYPGALFLAAGGYHHHLGLNTWSRGAAPPGDDDARLLEWTVVLPAGADVEAAAARLRAGGYDVNDDGGTAVVADPWGTRLRLRASDQDPTG